MLTIRNISTPLAWAVGDSPRLSGIFYEGSSPANLLDCTIRLYDNINPVVEKSISLTSKNILDHILDNQLYQVSGMIYLAGLGDSGAGALLDGELLSTGLTATIKTVTGTIPDSGWCKIESEWMQYIKSGLVLTLTRAKFNTDAAIHADETAIVFAGQKETLPGIEYNVKQIL